MPATPEIVQDHIHTRTVRSIEQNYSGFSIEQNTRPYHITRCLYQYDSVGNVNCVLQSEDTGSVRNDQSTLYQVDESGKLIDVRNTWSMPADSTWTGYDHLYFTFDGNGRILRIGDYTGFHYDANGNLDTLADPYPLMSFAVAPSLVDSYGNIISLPDYLGLTSFYYSRLLTGVDNGRVIGQIFYALAELSRTHSTRARSLNTP